MRYLQSLQHNSFLLMNDLKIYHSPTWNLNFGRDMDIVNQRRKDAFRERLRQHLGVNSFQLVECCKEGNEVKVLLRRRWEVIDKINSMLRCHKTKMKIVK